MDIYNLSNENCSLISPNTRINQFFFFLNNLRINVNIKYIIMNLIYSMVISTVMNGDVSQLIVVKDAIR